MGELINLNPVTEASLPPEMTRDTEVVLALLKAITLFPRSSSTGTAVNGDNCLTSSAAGYLWVDGNTVHTNLPAPTGVLFQADGLYTTSQQGLYRIQFFVAGTTQTTQTSVFVRHQNNGSWAPWRTL
ncbi:hypothetical protein [Microcoleus sp.]|uniref:hypothetical protein n=1 Tax=Microcoleus sp. TaxID=44472 RepID=UPI00403EB2C7